MIDINIWVKKFTEALDKAFGERVHFVGLQGSYARGEATDDSDIDMVVVLDELTPDDINKYNDMLDCLPNREFACGFLGGINELHNWDTADLFHLYYDTKPIKGNLDEISHKLDDDAVRRAIKLGVCNIYHGCVHNMLYERSEKILKGLYKSAIFVIQAICFTQTGRYVSTLDALSEAVSTAEQQIIVSYSKMKKQGIVCFDSMSGDLFEWTKNWIGAV